MNKKPKRNNGVISFSAIVEKSNRIGAGHFVRVPFDVKKKLGTKGRIRILGKMNDIAIDRALIPAGEGKHIISIGGEIRKKAKVKEGDKVAFEIYVNPEQDKVDIPEELIEAIALEPLAVKRFEKLTPGMKRNMAYWVNSGKLPETRAKRAVEILRRIMSGQLVFGGKKVND